MLKIILRILLLIFKKDKYIGEYKNGKKNGQGTFIRKNLFLGNFEYVGEYKDDKMCGKGTLKMSTSSWFYLGKIAYGQERIPNDSKYVGEFKDDKMCGKGTLLKGKLKYVGEFKDNRFNGNGSASDDNYEYVGEFKDDKMCGKGTLKNYPDNSIYVGEFKDDKRNGQGDFKGLLNSNEINFSGRYLDGEIVDGKGTILINNPQVFGLDDNSKGKVLECEWIKGKMEYKL